MFGPPAISRTSWRRPAVRPGVGTILDSLPRIPGVVLIVSIAAVYALAARLGLLLDAVGGFAAVVWAPTGIAIAAVLIVGYRAASGVFLGAFIANLVTGAPVAVAAAIGVGNMLEAVLAVFALRRLTTFDESLHRLSDVLSFMGIAVIAPIVSATIGVATLRAAAIIPSTQLGEAWRAWWVGDFIGALLVAPLILLWRPGARSRSASTPAVESLALAASVPLASALVFFAPGSADGRSFLTAYVLFPVFIWAAVRFEQRGAIATVFATSLIAVAGTARGGGPFAQADLHENLFALQTFMGIVAGSFLVLSTAIAERRRALESATDALAAEAAANRAKSEFLAVMSHELRTPLNAISGYAQLLTMGVQGSLTDKQLEAVRSIERNQQHLAALVTDVLSFTRTEVGRLPMHSQRVRVADALDWVGPMIEPERERKRIQLDWSFDSALTVRADPERLGQVLLNLVSNAIKYSEPGGRVEVMARLLDADVCIEVRDWGVGIPADQLARVFEPFFQVERGHTRKYPGIGLGLTIARDLARAMLGNVTLKPNADRGITASLVLPSA